jgi:hypothetical protein
VHGRDDTFKILAIESEGKRPLGARRNSEDTIIMDLGEIRWEDVDWSRS